MSLQRILEPEVMDSDQEARDYDQMDHAAVNQQFVSDLLAEGELIGDILDLGTGTAQIPIELCNQSEADFRIMAVDLSASMLDLARYNIEVACVIERVYLAQIDAKELPHEDELFDHVISNSIVHHIPEPAVAIKEAVRVVKEGGRLFFRDLLRPETTEQLDHLVVTYTGDENEDQQRMFAESLHAALTLEEVRNIVQDLGFDRKTVQATSDRHWTWSATK